MLAACSHAILTDPAMERINASVIDQLVITDSVPLAPEKESEKLVVLSLAQSLADVIVRIQSHRSVSLLFNHH